VQEADLKQSDWIMYTVEETLTATEDKTVWWKIIRDAAKFESFVNFALNKYQSPL